MLFVDVHCMDEIDRELLIPLAKVTEVHTNADGGDWILAENGKIYYPRNPNGFYFSVIDIQERREERGCINCGRLAGKYGESEKFCQQCIADNFPTQWIPEEEE